MYLLIVKVQLIQTLICKQTPNIFACCHISVRWCLTNRTEFWSVRDSATTCSRPPPKCSRCILDKRSLNNHFSVCRGKWSDCSTKPEETDCCGLPHKVQIQQKISYFVFRLPSYIQGSNSIKYLAWISCIFLPQLEQRLALPHLPSNSHPLHSQLHTGYVTIPLQLGGVKILKQNWLPWTCSGAWIRKELKLFIFYKMTGVGIWLGSPVSFAGLPPLARFTLSRLLRTHVACLE